MCERIFEPCFQVSVHTALAVPKGDDPARFPSRPMYARATPSFHGVPWFSNIAVQGTSNKDEFQEWYAQVRFFITCNVLVSEGKPDRKELAVVRYYAVVKDVDRLTGCKVLKWEKARPSYETVEVQHILRPVHIVPKFDTKDQYPLNRFLFEYT